MVAPIDLNSFPALGDSVNDDRSRIEATLRESEARFRRFVENASDLIYEVSSDGRFTYLSPRFEALYGYKVEEFLYQPFAPLIHPEDLPNLLNVTQQLFEIGEPQFGLEFRTRRKDGTWFWLICNNSPIKDDSDRVIGFHGIGRDGSDLKAAEIALKTSEKNLRTIFDNSNDAIFVHDTEAKLLDVNNRMLEMYRIANRAQALALNIEDCSASDNPFEQLPDLWAQALAGDVVRFEWKCKRPGDGSTFDGEVRLNKITFDGKEVVIASVQDISDRQAALRERDQIEKSLRQSEARFQAFMDHSPTAAWLVSQAGEMLYINKTYLQMFTLPTPDVVGKTLFDLYPKAMAEEFLQNIRTVAKNGKLLATIEPIPLSDGTLGDSLVYKFPVSDLVGSDLVGGIAIDITDLRRAEAALQDYGDRQALLNQLANQIRNSLDLNTVIATAMQSIRELLEIDHCCFAWYNSESSALTWELIQEARPDHVSTKLGSYPVSLVGPIDQRLFNQEVLRIDNVEHYAEPIHQAFLRQINCKSELLLPLQTHSGRVGMIICLIYDSPRLWTDNAVELLSAVGAQLAIAIDQAELYAQTRLKSQELEHALQELQRTQAQVVQSEKMSSLGQLVAGIAHEINNPVNFIHGNLAHADEYMQDLLDLLQLYQREYPNVTPAIANKREEVDVEFLSEDLPRLLSSMKVGTDRIREIVKSLRLFSRLDEAEVKPVDIHEGIDSTLMILHNRIKARSDHPEIQIIKNYGNLPAVECYAGQLNQVFMNILVNAIDALEESFVTRHSSVGKVDSPRINDRSVEHSRCNQEHTTNDHRPMTIPAITISTAMINPRQVQISIADNGSGMPELVKQRIFDPFFTTKPVGKGTGMGMSISYQIITEKHNGTLECHSTPGTGTKFVIHIPVCQSCT
ncbi:MAG: PAS domain S-box protein [Leptolyngbyaceae cyanobacterium bins.302]|nr:PAS domain S-box protein [Leptolyngbyaceae cyanobacterium bins.302]